MGVIGDFEPCCLVFVFCKGSWRVPGSQRWDHRGVSRSLGPQEGFCEGDLKVFVGQNRSGRFLSEFEVLL